MKRLIPGAAVVAALMSVSGTFAATVAVTKTQATNTPASVSNVTVTYIVDSGSSFNNSTFLAADATGSILVFRVGTVVGTSTTGPYATPTVGDNISISSNYQLFNQLSELTGSAATTPFSVTVNSTGNAVPAPLTYTLADLQDNNPVAETLESTRGTLTGVHFTSGVGTAFAAGTSYTVADSTGVLVGTVRTQAASASSGLALLGTTVPAGDVDIFGFVGQFSTTNALGGYQFSPVSVTATPEPASLSLLGLAGAAALRRRRA